MKRLIHPALILLTGVACLAGCSTDRQVTSGPAQPTPLSSSEPFSGDLKDPAGTHLAYARWREQVGDYEEARRSYELVLGEDSKSVDAILGVARIDQLAGRHAEADKQYSKALKLRPNDPQVMDAVGQFYAEQQRYEEALPLLKRAMLAAPSEKDYRYHLAVALARSGRIEESRPHFVQTVGDAEAHYNIGYIHYEEGRLAIAEHEFLQAVIKNPELGEAQAMLDEIRQGSDQELLLTGATTVPQRQQKGVQTAHGTAPQSSQPRGSMPNAPATIAHPQLQSTMPATGGVAPAPYQTSSHLDPVTRIRMEQRQNQLNSR